jgi:hypothetical protein
MLLADLDENVPCQGWSHFPLGQKWSVFLSYIINDNGDIVFIEIQFGSKNTLHFWPRGKWDQPWQGTFSSKSANNISPSLTFIKLLSTSFYSY